MIAPTDVLLLLALGTWAALDGTSLGQFMVARPLVSGTLAGWILGDPATGFAVGAVLEAAHLSDLPAGAIRFSEPGPAAVPAAAAAAVLGGSVGAVAVGAALGVVWAVLGGNTVVRLRRWNGRITEPLAAPGATAASLARLHLACIGADALRGLALVGSGLAAARFLPGGLPEAWAPGNATWGFGLLLLPGILAAGPLLHRWRAPKGGLRGAVLAGGVALGVLLGLAFGVGPSGAVP